MRPRWWDRFRLWLLWASLDDSQRTALVFALLFFLAIAGVSWLIK